jgi:Ca2+-binding EF-hand superfamily protein
MDGITVIRLLLLLAALSLTSVSFAQNQSTDSARGAMHFRAQEMDADKNGLISQQEFMTYHMGVWDKMTRESDGKMTVAAATAAFARGGMHIDASKMDPDHDGIISRDEFMKYEATHWSLLPKDASGQISITDLERVMQKRREQAAAAAATTKPD